MRQEASRTTPSAKVRAITEKELEEAEKHFVREGGERDHDNIGGDRMSPKHHGYATIYAKYLTSLLRARSGDPSPPELAEVGVLTGTGLAMWQRLFPRSRIFGFDEVLPSYYNNVHRLESLGMKTDNIAVRFMDQNRVTASILAKQHVFDASERLAVVVDDGQHTPDANEKTFFALMPYLAERFVYFIEDVTQEWKASGVWQLVGSRMLEHCKGCEFTLETPLVSRDNETLAIIHRF